MYQYKTKIPYAETSCHKIVDGLSAEFALFFFNQKYFQIDSVPISSGIDPTVRLIGSHISVLKKYLDPTSIPSCGIFIIQDCIRTQNLKYAFDDSQIKWGSHFKSLGALVSYDNLNSLIKDTHKFFTSILKIPRENILVRINSQDSDLFNLCIATFGQDIFEIDSKEIDYYKHEIGMQEVKGRNFNIALKHSQNGSFNDVGNIIVLEKNNTAIAVELALGTTTILQQIYGTHHVYDFYPLHLTTKFDLQNIARKLEDSIVVSAALLSEGLVPNSSDNKKRLLKTYLKTISYYRGLLKINAESLSEIILKYLRTVSINESIANTILTYISSYEQSIISNNSKSAEDEKIYNAIK
jgi:hypothetical protein